MVDYFDPNFYIYLNPELDTNTNEITVEEAYDHYINHGQYKQLFYDRSVFDKIDFNHMIYYSFYSNNILNDYSYLQSEIINELSNNSDFKRLSYIHFIRTDHSDEKKYQIDDNFNPNIYKLFHNITQEHLTVDDLYYDYLNNNNNIKIGSLNDIEYHLQSNWWLNELKVDKMQVTDELMIFNNTYISGSLGVSQGLFVDGGTIMVDSKNTVANIFNFPENIPFNFTKYDSFTIESNLLTLGEGFFTKDVVANSSLTVKGDTYLQNMNASNIVIHGNLNVLGEYNYIETDVKITDQLIIENYGSGTSLIVSQLSHDNDIANFLYSNNTTPILKVTKKGADVHGDMYISGKLTLDDTFLVDGPVHSSKLCPSQVLSLLTAP